MGLTGVSFQLQRECVAGEFEEWHSLERVPGVPAPGKRPEQPARPQEGAGGQGGRVQSRGGHRRALHRRQKPTGRQGEEGSHPVRRIHWITTPPPPIRGKSGRTSAQKALPVP